MAPLPKMGQGRFAEFPMNHSFPPNLTATFCSRPLQGRRADELLRCEDLNAEPHSCRSLHKLPTLFPCNPGKVMMSKLPKPVFKKLSKIHSAELVRKAFYLALLAFEHGEGQIFVSEGSCGDLNS